MTDGFPDRFAGAGRSVFCWFIPLDIFAVKLQNKGINSKLDAWLAFLSSEEPEIIIKIIKMYPEFAGMFAHVYQICQSIEMVMEMFLKELLELD